VSPAPLGGGGGSVAGASASEGAFESSEPTLPESIQVKLLSDGRKGTLIGNKGVLYSIDVGGDVVSASRDDLEIIRPTKKDRLIILKGELAGLTGTLIGIDGVDGIVKMAANSDIKILDLESCAKMADNIG